eukprot:6329193-Pyramimonas_sp.AAC.1
MRIRALLVPSPANVGTNFAVLVKSAALIMLTSAFFVRRVTASARNPTTVGLHSVPHAQQLAVQMARGGCSWPLLAALLIDGTMVFTLPLALSSCWYSTKPSFGTHEVHGPGAEHAAPGDVPH